MLFRDNFPVHFDRKALTVSFVLCVLTVLGVVSGYAAEIGIGGDTPVQKLVKKATKLIRDGQNVPAEELLRKALEIEPTSIEAKTELAFALVKQRRVRAAYDICVPLAEANPKNARVLAVLGATLLTGGRFDEARQIFDLALSYDRKQHLAWAGAGMLDFYENKISSSLNRLQEAAFLKPDEPDYLFAFGQVAARSEYYREAADAYDRFLITSKNTDKDRRERIQGLIRFLKYLGSVKRLYISAGKDQTSVPFDLVGNRPVIRLRVNGSKQDLRFVLDTGSGISVLSDETAKRLKVKPVARGGFASGVGGDGKFEIVYAHLRSVAIGDVELKNVPVYVRKFHDPTSEVDGYIGLALISKFLTTIDYGTQTFAMTRKDADRTGFAANGDVSIPLRLTSSGFLSGEVQLQGIESPLNFIVDTGASVSVISDAVSRTDGISHFIKNDEKMRVIGSAGITDDVPTFLLPKVSFGEHSVASVKAIALNLDVINEASGFEQAGILGGNFLKNYRLTFDFKNSRVTFVPLLHDKE